MPAPIGVPVIHTSIVTEERRQEINAGLQHEDETGEVLTPGWRKLNQGEYDDLATFLRVGDITIKQWFSMYPDGDPPEWKYRPCLPPEIVGRRPFRIVPMPGYKQKTGEDGEPVQYTDMQIRRQMRWRLWLCATIGRDELGLPVGYEREPIFTGTGRTTLFPMATITKCLRKMREIIEGNNTFFLFQAWRRFYILYNEDDLIGPQGWILFCEYNTIGAGDDSQDVENFPAEEEGEVE